VNFCIESICEAAVEGVKSICWRPEGSPLPQQQESAPDSVFLKPRGDDERSETKRLMHNAGIEVFCISQSVQE